MSRPCRLAAAYRRSALECLHRAARTVTVAGFEAQASAADRALDRADLLDPA